MEHLNQLFFRPNRPHNTAYDAVVRGVIVNAQHARCLLLHLIKLRTDVGACGNQELN